MKKIILGAGITGLAASYKTGFPIYESKDVPGGLCRSYYKDGYRFEVGGGHWIFGDREIVEFINRLSTVKSYTKDTGVYFNNIFPAPLQKFTGVEEPINKGSMKEWLREKFGNDLCRMFFYPFNNKYTCGFYESVPQTDPGKSPSSKGKEYNETFTYPGGGLDHLVDEMAKGSDIRYNKLARKIDLKEKVVYFGDGEEVKYDRIISTIPLKELLDMAGIENDLLYTSVFVLNIGADKGKYLPKEQWLYVPFCRNKFFRVGFYSNVEPTFAPINKVSIYVERALSDGAEFYGVKLSYMNDVMRELQRWGWIGKVDTMDIKRIKYAYTWNKNVKKYLKLLENHGITSIGRYGKWKFQGISESIEDGLSL